MNAFDRNKGKCETDWYPLTINLPTASHSLMKWPFLRKETLSRSLIVIEFANCFQNDEYSSLSTPTPTPSSLPPLSLMTVNNNEEFTILVSLKCSIISLQISERCTVNGITPWSSCTLEGPGQDFPSSCKTLDKVTVQSNVDMLLT